MIKAGKKSHEIVVEHLSSTAVTADIVDDWRVTVDNIEELIDTFKDEMAMMKFDGNEWLEVLEPALDFLMEFQIDSEQVISVNAFDIEPRSCGSCHMLGADYGSNKYAMVGWKCVYENGPSFPFPLDTRTKTPALETNAQWFKLCEYYIRRVD